MKLIRSICCIALFPIVVLSCVFSNARNNKNDVVLEDTVVRFGILADIQYCDCDTRGSRYYRGSLQKLDECVDNLNKEKIQFTVNLGDLVDRDTPHNIDPILFIP